MKRKGFTLIELLAVIVILAIIALIAVPVVIRAIEQAQQGSAKSTAGSYLQAVDFTVQMERVTDPSIDFVSANETTVTFTGTPAKTATIEMKNAKSVASATLNSAQTGSVETSNGYCVTITAGEVGDVTKGECD